MENVLFVMCAVLVVDASMREKPVQLLRTMATAGMIREHQLEDRKSVTTWCDGFLKGADATEVCDNGNDKVFSSAELEDAKAYCGQKADCVGVTRHGNGKYTPRCGSIVTGTDTYWLNRDGCLPECTGSFHESYRPTAGTKCALPCERHSSGRWGASFCYTQEDKSQWGAECVACVFLAPESCEDGIKNQHETDTDCGGTNCSPCRCQYVHLVNYNGYPAETTCETLGYESIRQKEECDVVFKNIPDISGYTTSHSATGCDDYKPNHCYTIPLLKSVYFTRDDCPLHARTIDYYVGMICKTCKA